MGIQSIPAVIAFVGGQPADGFMGAVPESQVNAFGNLIDNPLGDENLHPDVRVGCLKCADKWSKQRVRNAGWRREP